MRFTKVWFGSERREVTPPLSSFDHESALIDDTGGIQLEQHLPDNRQWKGQYRSTLQQPAGSRGMVRNRLSQKEKRTLEPGQNRRRKRRSTLSLPGVVSGLEIPVMPVDVDLLCFESPNIEHKPQFRDQTDLSGGRVHSVGRGVRFGFWKPSVS